MERLAARGIRFNNFYAMSVCSPTRISIMTGQNAARHRATNWINPGQEQRGSQRAAGLELERAEKRRRDSAAAYCRSGYRTIHVGKGHFGPRDIRGRRADESGIRRQRRRASFGAPGSYYGEENYGLATSASSSAVPHLEKYHGTRDISHRGPDHRGQAAQWPRRSQTASRSTCTSPTTPCTLRFNSDPRFAAHYADSGKACSAQAFATLIEGMDKSLGDMLDHLTRWRCRKHADFFPRRQRFGRAAGAPARGGLRGAVARQERRRITRVACACPSSPPGQRPNLTIASAAIAHPRGAIQPQWHRSMICSRPSCI